MAETRSTPLVSFVVPCYNYGRYLPDCLRGIFGQKGNYDFEIIAIDDGSTDNTRDVLRDFADPRLRVIVQEKNLGHVATVNSGLAETRGKYVVRVDPDDRHHSCFLQETVPILERYPEVGLVYGDVSLINEEGDVTAECGADLAKEDRKGNELLPILHKNYICAPTVVARREAWMSAWPVPEGLAFNDWYFNVMLARRYEYYYVNTVLADYRVHSANHHARIVVNKTEEPSVLWVLDKVYNESESNLELETAKQRARPRVYASHYLDFAEKYFGAQLNADARRCYWHAIRQQPSLLLRAGIARRFAATLGRSRYERGKRLFSTITALSRDYQRGLVTLTKTIAREHFPRTHATLRYLYRFPSDYWKPKPGDIPSLLEKFCSRLDHPVSFIQIGANNGNDEFALLRRKYGWTGIMVEPQREVFAELVASNETSGMIFEPVAIADRDSERILYKISFSRSSWATTLASFDKTVIDKSISNGWIARCAAEEGISVPNRLEDYYCSETVRCTTLINLADKHQLKCLDVLIIDTEGYDFDILKQIRNLQFQPRLVVFEHKYFSRSDLRICVSLLRSWGYQLYADASNTICLLKSQQPTTADLCANSAESVKELSGSRQ